MNKSENTLNKLEAALERILTRTTKRILNTRKLSIRAVEEEAGLGNGSCYYYPSFIAKVRQLITDSKSSNDAINSDKRTIDAERLLRKEKSLKEKYRKKAESLKSQIKQMSANQQQLNYELYNALKQVQTLETELLSLRKSVIRPIK